MRLHSQISMYNVTTTYSSEYNAFSPIIWITLRITGIIFANEPINSSYTWITHRIPIGTGLQAVMGRTPQKMEHISPSIDASMQWVCVCSLFAFAFVRCFAHFVGSFPACFVATYLAQPVQSNSILYIFLIFAPSAVILTVSVHTLRKGGGQRSFPFISNSCISFFFYLLP
jgi:hypothetical protein